MDDISQFNQDRWNNLVKHRVVCSHPLLDITEEQAKERINQIDHFGTISEKEVLCLASGGGQQSVAFAKLGAQVTVTDLSEAQLEKDAQASLNNQLPLRMIHADMRDFSHFNEAEFDIIYQPYSINYVPDVAPVLDGVAASLKAGGIYYLMFHNPITHGSWTNGSWGLNWKPEELWRGHAYPIRHLYQEGLPIEYEHNTWHYTDFSTGKGIEQAVPAPQEFKHTLSTLLNGLIQRGFHILEFRECPLPQQEQMQDIGSWEHYQGYAAPWMEIWARKN